MRKVTVSYNTATEAKQMVTIPGLLRMDADVAAWSASLYENNLN